MDSLSMGHAHFGGLYGVRGTAHNQASNFQQLQQQQPASYEVWNNFFMSAGIPSGVAHEYAVTFSQHRIRIDMLKEITKDILIDMGIKAMGDIIAILRHAKQICTQNELKANTSAAKTITSNSNLNRSMPVISSPVQQTHTASANAPPKPHLSQRTPITLDRGSASVSSMIGNKIPSKLNLDSGALIASSSSLTTTIIRNSNSSSNKRPASTLSNAMAKRLRPADSDRMSEKTLTVHYPPRAAIERAARRISGGTSNQSQKTGSIKSRLGSTASHSGRGSESFNQTAAVTNNNKHKQRNNRGNSMTPNKNASSSSGRRQDSRQSRERGTSSSDTRRRPRSTVFNRLGESAR